MVWESANLFSAGCLSLRLKSGLVAFGRSSACADEIQRAVFVGLRRRPARAGFARAIRRKFIRRLFVWPHGRLRMNSGLVAFGRSSACADELLRTVFRRRRPTTGAGRIFPRHQARIHSPALRSATSAPPIEIGASGLGPIVRLRGQVAKNRFSSAQADDRRGPVLPAPLGVNSFAGSSFGHTGASE